MREKLAYSFVVPFCPALPDFDKPRSSFLSRIPPPGNLNLKAETFVGSPSSSVISGFFAERLKLCYMLHDTLAACKLPLKTPSQTLAMHSIKAAEY